MLFLLLLSLLFALVTAVGLLATVLAVVVKVELVAVDVDDTLRRGGRLTLSWLLPLPLVVMVVPLLP